MSLKGAASANASLRELMGDSVTAGLPVGILYGLAILWLATPALAGINLAEQGPSAMLDMPSPLTTMLGATGLTIGVSLLLTPVCRALGPSVQRIAVAAGTGSAIVYGLLLIQAGTVPDVSSPHAAALAEQLRHGALLANVVLCAGLALAIPLTLRGRS